MTLYKGTMIGLATFAIAFAINPVIKEINHQYLTSGKKYQELLDESVKRAALLYGDKKEPLTEAERNEWLESIGSNRYYPNPDSLKTFLSLSEELLGKDSLEAKIENKK